MTKLKYKLSESVTKTYTSRIAKDIKYITLKLYSLYLSPKQGFEHVTEYRPEAEAEGRCSVTCSNPSFGGENIMRTNLT